VGLEPRLKVSTLLDMNPVLVRQQFNGIEELARSMKAHGQLYPLVVRDDLLIISGGRRLLAAQLLRWKEVAAVVTSSHDTVVNLMIKEREHDNDPDVDPVLKQTPMGWLEMADLIGRVLYPLELAQRMEHRRTRTKAVYVRRGDNSNYHITERMLRICESLGVDLNYYKAYSAFGGALRYARTPERVEEIKELLAFHEAQGHGVRYAQRVLSNGGLKERPTKPTPPPRLPMPVAEPVDSGVLYKIQREKLEGITATLKLLGGELEAAFTHVSPAADPAWLAEAQEALTLAQKPFRAVRAKLRLALRNPTTEENQ